MLDPIELKPIGNSRLSQTIEIAQDVAKRLIEAQDARHVERLLPQAAESFDYPMIVNA